jgi:hypothetical protein
MFVSAVGVLLRLWKFCGCGDWMFWRLSGLVIRQWVDWCAKGVAIGVHGCYHTMIAAMMMMIA